MYSTPIEAQYVASMASTISPKVASVLPNARLPALNTVSKSDLVKPCEARSKSGTSSRLAKPNGSNFAF